jgi:3-hydroxyisobutyrate dehydrogenase-like beta-hydroxyacid dehydrogenase
MSETRIGWIGTGVMGTDVWPLDRQGYPTTIYSRTKSRRSLLDKGAAWADTGAVTERSDIIFTIVGLPSDVRRYINRRAASSTP